MTDVLKNLANWYGRRDTIDEEEGRAAYARYRAVMVNFADHYGFPLGRTVSAFVALSPNNDYHGNLRSLASVLDGVRCGVEPEKVVVSTYGACKRRAMSYLDGTVDFLATVKGPKTRAFRDNILRPHSSREVTIDGHMVAAAHDQDLTMVEAVAFLGSNKKYNALADAVRVIADDVGINPCQLQAVIWFTRKRIKRIRVDIQLDLFQSRKDNWRVLCDPEDYPPFPNRT